MHQCCEFAAMTGPRQVPKAPPTFGMKINPEGVAVSTTSCWLYPAAGYPAPAGAVVQLLTKGGIQCKGTWSDDGRFIAWAPNLQRDKALEERLGLS